MTKRSGNSIARQVTKSSLCKYASCILALWAVPLSWHASAATLADWNLGEATNGLVVMSLDSSGHPLRNLRPPTAADGYGGGGAPHYTSFPTFPGSDGRGVDFASSVGLLVTSNKFAFSTSDFAGGFTWEAVYKMSNPLPDGGRRFLSSIAGYYNIAVFDGDPSAAVSPLLGFTFTGSFGTGLTAPIVLDGNFHHVAGIYDPSKSIDGIDTTFLYYDYTLKASNSTSILANFDAFPDFGTVGGAPIPSSPQSMAEVIDRVRIVDQVLSVDQFIPEPSVALLVIVGGTLLLRRRR